MEIIGIISGKGGSGKSTLAKYLALELSKEYKVLLIDSDFGFRTLDLMLGEEDAIYDIYDFSTDSDDLSSINEIDDNENLDFICASQSKTIDDCNMEILNDKLKKLEELYKYCIIDIPRDENTIIKWSQFIDRFFVLTDDSDVSIRLTDKIMYIFLKNKIVKETDIIFNGLKNCKEFNLEDKYEIFMGPRVKIISKIPFLTDIDGQDNMTYMAYMQDIKNFLVNDVINIREIEDITKNVKKDDEAKEKGFFQKLFGK